MPRARILPVLALVTACGGAAPTPSTAGTAVQRRADPHEPAPAEDAMLDELNQRARAGAVLETLHGLDISDPYRALEEESELTRTWIEAQNARTRRALDDRIDPTASRRLERLLSIGTLGSVAVGGDRVFYTKREGDREQPVLYGRPLDGGRATMLVDPLDHGERAALDWHYPSPRGKYVAFGISDKGDERSTLHIVDVESGQLLPDRIPRTKWTNLAWLPDETGFYYTRYPKPGEPGYDAQDEDAYFPRVFFHPRGADPAADPLVYGSERGTDFPGPSVSDDGRWLVINVFRGWTASDVYLFDRGRRGEVAPTASRPLETVVEGRDALTVGEVHADRLYLFTNEGAPRWRVLSVQPQHASRRAAWREVIPENPDATIESWTFSADRLAVHHVEDVASRVRLFRLDGTAAGDVALPTEGSVSGLSGQDRGRRIAFELSSYLHPPSLMRYEVDGGDPLELDRVEADVELADYEVTRTRVDSTDGVEVPVTLLHARGLVRDGNNPVLLTGYGGFNVSILPSFTRHALYWLEHGGVYAVANLRGGSELGETWHRAGSRENKENVFEDFEAVLDWLSKSGISRPGRIAITGRSNGGLLMGAAITRVPDRFRAAAAYVGLYDMVRYTEFPPAELWTTEYGDPAEPDALRWLHRYSPYHQVRDGTAYPAVLIETADHDSRVHWAHSTKLAARLQEATRSARPVYFYMERALGHGAGTRRSDLVRRYARMYAFLAQELNLSK